MFFKNNTYLHLLRGRKGAASLRGNSSCRLVNGGLPAVPGGGQVAVWSLGSQGVPNKLVGGPSLPTSIRGQDLWPCEKVKVFLSPGTQALPGREGGAPREWLIEPRGALQDRGSSPFSWWDICLGGRPISLWGDKDVCISHGVWGHLRRQSFEQSVVHKPPQGH